MRGKGLGKQFGFPTANIALFQDMVIPSPGVYITKSILRERIYQSITSVGVNPTLGDNPTTIETHIINYDEDIYGSQLEVYFYQKIRDEMRFNSIEELIAQVNKDILITKKFFAI